ncbi:hypothetical protein SAMN02745824_0448 [Parasphingorhabdus marina DSM 22363]|uniref:DUF2059 domain-containing protein n=1 Tax=Parasphingorhabdus marina DSM 22363 TaxID=1123272 RepID=A0A1N6CMW1_9SPHN|nr:DUF2059 domain-containing protein [Parasphingorhabdus marina]SIN59910.1 hypothetical protein SAMN02745824_0448 [Parasphingorhabdus marina DSM 22363]
MNFGKFLIPAISLLALSSPSLAQESAAPATASAEATAIDPARLEAAKKTVDYLFPLGTYERMMRGTMDQLIDSMLGSLGTMRIGDLAGASGVAGEDIPEGEGDRTLAEISREADPHFEERMQITTRVMMDEMVTLMTAMEPAIRDTLVNIYARKFTVGQLDEMNRFFATDTGSAFARDYMMVFVDPEMMQSMMSMVPEMMQAMPDIMKKVQDATAHLPPVKLPGTDGFDDNNTSDEDTDITEDDSSWEDPENWSKEDQELVNRLSNESDVAFEKYFEALETAQQNAKARLQKN